MNAYGFASAPDDVQDRLIDRLAETGVAITTAAIYDFPVAPVRRLRAAGVTVACGHDGIQDLWGPFGTGDMLDRAMHLAYRNTFRRDDDIAMAFEAATTGGATVLGLDATGLAVGGRADLVAVPASSVAEAVVKRPPRELVMKDGRAVAIRGILQ